MISADMAAGLGCEAEVGRSRLRGGGRDRQRCASL